MPLVRREQTASGGPHGNVPSLSSQDMEQRRQAALALAGDGTALPRLAAALAVETAAPVREALLDAIAGIGTRAAALVLLPALRSDDAGVRNAALVALQTMPSVLPGLLPDLLIDGDSDVRVLAAELARALPPVEATGILCRMLEGETHANVCGAAMDVLAQVGTADALPCLQVVADRFAGDAFIGFAARTAMARIRG
ncbi:HEAT repeat domain-containing protein [Niveispirillum sp.]|uniref:HEAT repeat domain-containing protein n=1 Tax=Niveispirillum sp. TaxID=1917217 RepID=UPI001B555F3C|nr:HEAT repeat domain-containing protein [Niveispirillum sp.]MBP7339295.1 HEAT repeat domain-containing protein [Niveispirillum sp.]